VHEFNSFLENPETTKGELYLTTYSLLITGISVPFVKKAEI
jgi:hypothetical protein